MRFTQPLLLGGSEYRDAPKLAIDAKGTLHLAYAVGQRVRYTRSTDGARSFAAPRELGKGAFPSLALDAQGGVYVTWELARGLGVAVSRGDVAVGHSSFEPGKASRIWLITARGR